MSGWVKTVDGLDVYEQGDGWVWFPRENGWRHEPNLLTMPVAPMGERVRAEAKRLSRDWPSLKEAWALLPEPNPGIGGYFTRFLRLYVLLYAVYMIAHAALIYRTIGSMFGSGYVLTGAEEMQTGVMFGAGLVALLFIFMVWHIHVHAIDPHKGWAVAGAVGAGIVLSHHLKRQRAIDEALRNGNYPPE